jgi:hypothetical protein
MNENPKGLRGLKITPTMGIVGAVGLVGVYAFYKTFEKSRGVNRYSSPNTDKNKREHSYDMNPPLNASK